MTSPVYFLVPSGDLALFFALFVSVCVASWADSRARILAAGFAAVALFGIAANAITISALARPPAPAQLAIYRLVSWTLVSLQDVGLVALASGIWRYLASDSRILGRFIACSGLSLVLVWIATFALNIAALRRPDLLLPFWIQPALDGVFLLATMPVSAGLFGVWRARVREADRRASARFTIRSLPLVLLGSTYFYAITTILLEIPAVFFALGVDAAMALKIVWLVCRAAAFVLLLCACRGIGWHAWEHQLPRFVVFFVGPASGYGLVSEHEDRRLGVYYVEKTGLRPWWSYQGQGTQSSFKMITNEMIIHRVTTTITNPRTSTTTERIVYLAGSAPLELALQQRIADVERSLADADRDAAARNRARFHQALLAAPTERSDPMMNRAVLRRTPEVLRGRTTGHGSENSARTTAFQARGADAALPQPVWRRARSEMAPVAEEFELGPVPPVARLPGGFV
ncbi:hypothetical protein SLS58_002876 [Diplodia intermedia]|uniref:Integral membrane protein n=1 Tax=Diplodia intermedia TaxID=856260 RepID=A0ABR3TXW0_9PEZI